MLRRDEWLDLARKLDWEFSYVREADAFPPVAAGTRGCRARDWRDWDEPYRTTLRRVRHQPARRRTPRSTRCATRVGGVEDFAAARRRLAERRSSCTPRRCRSPSSPRSSATCARRASAATAPGATTALLGALDEFRHTQIPLLLMHELVRVGRAVRLDAQASTTRTTGSRSPRATWSTSCCSASNADRVRDRAPTSSSRPASPTCSSSGSSSLAHERRRPDVREDGDEHPERRGAPRADRRARCWPSVVEHDRAYAQYLVDKWFWRSWLLFAVVTGFAMDYLTPLEHRTASFKEFMEEWVVDQFLRTLEELGLERPWYWDTFLERARPLPPHGLRERVHAIARRSGSTSCVPGPDGARLAARRSTRESWDELRSGLGADHRALARRRSRQRLRRPRHGHRRLLRSLPARAVRRHAARSNSARTSSSTAGSKLHLLLRAVPLDLRAGAGALRARTRTSSSACSPARRRPT